MLPYDGIMKHSVIFLLRTKLRDEPCPAPPLSLDVGVHRVYIMVGTSLWMQDVYFVASSFELTFSIC